MATISPLLQNRIIPTTGGKTQTTTKTQIPNNSYEKVYRDLEKRANDVRPNEAKAVIVKEGMLGNPVAATTDCIKDVGNFFKAVKTGKMGDNSLGRMNDLGLKVGAGLIATYLAAHSRTKTESIMRFLGGGIFIASMSLWPKIFINIPARLVHGFRIDRKYISTQGDKKDFGLDNQFLVWDAYPEEQLRKDAQNAGIDYDSKNGKEKIQTKIQKTMLQNRTLNMLAAGFATPLTTALVCNALEPHVQKAVVNHGVNKTQNIIAGGIKEYLENVKPQVRNASALKELIENKQNVPLDRKFFVELAEILNPYDFANEFKDKDGLVPLDNITPFRLAEQLESAHASLSETCFEPSALIEELEKAKKAQLFAQPLGKDQASAIVSSLGGDYSLARVEQALKDNDICDESIKAVFANTKTDNKKFFDYIEKLNNGPIAQLRARTKAYLNLTNPVLGSQAESATTLEYKQVMSKIFKALEIEEDGLMALRKSGDEEAIETLSGIIGNVVDKANTKEKYRELIGSFGSESLPENATKLIEALEKSENIKQIVPDFKIEGADVDSKAMKQAFLGSLIDDGGLFHSVKKFIDLKQVDLNAIKSKIVLCANFERRIKEGGDLASLTDAQKMVARKVLYDGTISTAFNNAYMADEKAYRKLMEQIFDREKFGVETSVLGEKFAETVDDLKSLFVDIKGKINLNYTPAKAYTSCGSFIDHMHKAAKNFGNNKAWMKLFSIMAGVLVAGTLLVQPFFGKIDKEFPADGKNGGSK